MDRENEMRKGYSFEDWLSDRQVLDIVKVIKTHFTRQVTVLGFNINWDKEGV